MGKNPRRADIWLAELAPVVGLEQDGLRPVLILSVDRFNKSATDLCIVLPITSALKGLPIHIPVDPPEGGLVKSSVIKCECIRSISQDRLVRKIGTVTGSTLEKAADVVKILLGL